jgi:hypothetical protein
LAQAISADRANVVHALIESEHSGDAGALGMQVIKRKARQKTGRSDSPGALSELTTSCAPLSILVFKVQNRLLGKSAASQVAQSLEYLEGNGAILDILLDEIASVLTWRRTNVLVARALVLSAESRTHVGRDCSHDTAATLLSSNSWLRRCTSSSHARSTSFGI